MNNMATTSKCNIEATLIRLGIRYRKTSLEDGNIYFCSLSNYTFNLFVSNDEKIKLWSFISTVPLAQAGVRFEYHKAELPSALIGIEVTEEGDLCLYAEQTITREKSQQEYQVYMVVSSYFKVISNLKSKSIKA